MIERIKCSDTATMTKPKDNGATATAIVAAVRTSGMSTRPFGLGSSRRVDVFRIDVFIAVLSSRARAGSLLDELFADHLFAFPPQRLRALRIEGVRAYATAQT